MMRNPLNIVSRIRTQRHRAQLPAALEDRTDAGEQLHHPLKVHEDELVARHAELKSITSSGEVLCEGELRNCHSCRTRSQL